MQARRRCAVLGSPIAHSLSPTLHRAAYAELGLDWDYGRVEVTEAGLPGFLAGLDPTWRGLSLTMPLKRAVMPLLHEVGAQAARAGAANTVLVGEGGHLRGDNTDVPGAVAALRERHDGPVRRAVVLGGGATAASTLLALADLGCREAVLAVREPARAAETREVVARHAHPPSLDVVRLGAVTPGECDVVVSTVPADAQDAWACEVAGHAAVVFDVVYDPWPTPLMAAARRGGATLVTGLDLLVHQAALQVELMTGRAGAPLAAMRAAGEVALGVDPADR